MRLLYTYVKGYDPKVPIKTLEVPVLAAAPVPDEDTPSPRSVIFIDFDDLGPFLGEEAPIFQMEDVGLDAEPAADDADSRVEIGAIVVHKKLLYEVKEREPACAGDDVVRWSLWSSYPVQKLVATTAEVLAMERAPVACHVTVENETVKQVARLHNILPGDLVRANGQLVGITQNCRFFAHTILRIPQ